ncbi:hypothetical protein MYX75_08710 [Acidobacteria bacterium AH-259-A15]|nr:hypothetical protein [Acidobacteria bacterium AH-259-A15]
MMISSEKKSAAAIAPPMGFQEGVPRHPLASLRSWLDTVFFQDSFDGVPPYPVAQITQSASDSGVTPDRIVFRHPDDECLYLLRTPGATWCALFAAVVLLGDQLSVPTQQRIGCDDAGKVSQGLSSYDLGLFSDPPSLGVGEAQPFVANLFTEYAVFLFEVIDCILLCTIDPTRSHQQQKLQRQVHEGYRIPFVQTGQTN